MVARDGFRVQYLGKYMCVSISYFWYEYLAKMGYFRLNYMKSQPTLHLPGVYQAWAIFHVKCTLISQLNSSKSRVFQKYPKMMMVLNNAGFQ